MQVGRHVLGSGQVVDQCASLLHQKSKSQPQVSPDCLRMQVGHNALCPGQVVNQGAVLMHQKSSNQRQF